MTWIVHTGDALEVLRVLPASSVDAIITDPPYGTTQLAWDHADTPWAKLWIEFARLLRAGGNVVVFSAQPFTTDLIASNRAWFRYDLVWRKTTATRFLDANRRPLLTHETILVFGPKRGFYAPQKAYVGNRGKNADRGATSTRIYGTDKPTSYRDDGWRHPTTVLDFAKPPRVGAHHPSEKPVDLMRWLVRSYVPAGGVVLDPFAGSGSTGVAARREGRAFVGVELNGDYADMARQRIATADPIGRQEAIAL